MYLLCTVEKQKNQNWNPSPGLRPPSTFLSYWAEMSQTSVSIRNSYFCKLFTNACHFCKRAGRHCDRIFCGAHHLTWSGQWHSQLLGAAVLQGSTPAGKEGWQVSREQRQSTAVWLWKQPIGRTLLPAPGISWCICYSCRSVYSECATRGLKKKKERKPKTRCCGFSKCLPAIQSFHAASLLLGLKRNFL